MADELSLRVDHERRINVLCSFAPFEIVYVGVEKDKVKILSGEYREDCLDLIGNSNISNSKKIRMKRMFCSMYERAVVDGYGKLLIPRFKEIKQGIVVRVLVKI